MNLVTIMAVIQMDSYKQALVISGTDKAIKFDEVNHIVILAT